MDDRARDDVPTLYRVVSAEASEEEVALLQELAETLEVARSRLARAAILFMIENPEAAAQAVARERAGRPTRRVRRDRGIPRRHLRGPAGTQEP